MTALHLRRVSLAPGMEGDLLVVDGTIADGPPPPDARVIDLEGRPVVPGLSDHHLHLLALAASWSSVDLSPAALDHAGGLDVALRRAHDRQPDGWLRGVDYDVLGSGPIDRTTLDAVGVGPVRVQDRSGSRWFLDSVGLAAVLPEDEGDRPDGVAIDAAGRPTGELVRLDPWLRTRLGDPSPDVGRVGHWLATRGVTSLTDAGAQNGPAELAILAVAGLPQRLTAMTRDADIEEVDGVAIGPVKVLLDDDRLPTLDDLARRIDAAHRRGRAVAVHCVTDVQVVLALAAGLDHRDRIEHGTYVPEGLLAPLAAAGVTIVVQPGLVLRRGDRYLEDHTADEVPALHRLASFVRAGIPVAIGSDAPYGPSDPWDAVTAAATRRTRAGATLGDEERIDAPHALRLLSGTADAPGVPQAITTGRPADLVVLDDEWDAVDRHPEVLATLRDGHVIAGRLPD